MNNREIVDYILSNKLTKDQVIKEIDEDNYVMYIWNDKCDIWDDNGEISIFRFCDDKDYPCKYEVISQEQAEEEIDEKEKQEEIEKLEEKLKQLKGE